MWLAHPPVVVVEGPREAFARVVADLDRAGWQVTEGFGRHHRPNGSSRGRDVLAGAVRTIEDAGAALLAVLAGKGVVIHGCAPGVVLDQLLGDLHHVGPVDHRRVPGPPRADELDADARAILSLLAQGRTLGVAARALGLSRRTADRRLAEARRALRVERTVEAVARARKLGWLGPPTPG